MPFLLSAILVFQYIAIGDIFMSVIGLKEPLKFSAVVISSEGTFVSNAKGMQISTGFHSLVLCMCVR